MHRDKIADRLAAESKQRQVIIFTHDIAFLFLLNKACATHDVHIGFRTSARNDEFAGYCHADAPSNAQPVERVIESTESQLTNHKVQDERGDQAAWQRTVKLLQEQLRETWERAVEDTVAPSSGELAAKSTRRIGKTHCRNRTCSRLLHSTPGSLNPRFPDPQIPVPSSLPIWNTLSFVTVV